MATTAIKLKIAKTKPAPHKILPVEYRCVHFWNSSTTSAFQTAILPLFGGIFLGAKSTHAKKPFLCHFFTAVMANGDAVFARAFRPAKTNPALIRIASAYNRFIADFSLNPQLSTLNYLAGLLSIATFFSKTIPVLVGDAGLVLTSRHAGWGKTR